VRGGRAPYANHRQRGARQGIEDRRLARASSTGKRYYCGASGHGKPPIGLTNYAPCLAKSVRLDPTLAQLRRLTQGPKMINEVRADILTAE
jgi:hypothetical protein